jgi:hypothetical protein
MDRGHLEAGRGDRRRRGCGARADGRQEPAAGGGDAPVGRFERGDTVSILGPDGVEVARGICAYSDGDAARIIGRKSADIEKVLGFRGRDEIVHRDDLVLLRAHVKIRKRCERRYEQSPIAPSVGADRSDARGIGRARGRAVLALAPANRRTAPCAPPRPPARRRHKILAANERDMREAVAKGLSPALLDRLKARREARRGHGAGLEDIAGLRRSHRHGTGRVVAAERHDVIQRVRVPLGVIGIIYESRPNVTADAGALCLKSSNAVILRGGSESAQSSAAIHACLQEGLRRRDCPQLYSTGADHRSGGGRVTCSPR